jgi:hypothetical protein
MYQMPEINLGRVVGEQGPAPVKGTDYWTDADKAEIVSDVLEAMNDAEEAAF